MCMLSTLISFTDSNCKERIIVNSKSESSVDKLGVAQGIPAYTRENGSCASKKTWAQPCLEVLSAEVTAGKVYNLTEVANITPYGPS